MGAKDILQNRVSKGMTLFVREKAHGRAGAASPWRIQGATVLETAARGVRVETDKDQQRWVLWNDISLTPEGFEDPSKRAPEPPPKAIAKIGDVAARISLVKDEETTVIATPAPPRQEPPRTAGSTDESLKAWMQMGDELLADIEKRVAALRLEQRSAEAEIDRQRARSRAAGDEAAQLEAKADAIRKIRDIA